MERKMAKKSTADIGFEKQIWEAACVLRGNLDASEYKSVVLGLIFLKYISNRVLYPFPSKTHKYRQNSEFLIRRIQYVLFHG